MNSSSSTRLANRIPAAGALALALLCASCGGEPESPASVQAASSGESRTAAAATPPAATRQEEPGLCAVFPLDAVSTAFGGKLRLAPGTDRADRCVYRVEFGSSDMPNELVIARIGPEIYAAKEDWENKSMPFERLSGIGQEAFLLNNAELLVEYDESHHAQLALTLIAFGEPLPLTPEEVRAGLVELAPRMENAPR